MKKILAVAAVLYFLGFAFFYHFETSFDWEADQKVTEYYIDADQ